MLGEGTLHTSATELWPNLLTSLSFYNAEKKIAAATNISDGS